MIFAQISARCPGTARFWNRSVASIYHAWVSEEPDQAREERSRYGEQDAWGNSIGSLRLSLKLTMVERLDKADRSARSTWWLKNALRRTH